jgi:hypothetical protein
MRTSLSDYNPLDSRSTIGARLTSTLINPEVVLKITTPVDPVYTGAVGADAFLQGLTYGSPQFLSLKRREKV